MAPVIHLIENTEEMMETEDPRSQMSASPVSPMDSNEESETESQEYAYGAIYGPPDIGTPPSPLGSPASPSILEDRNNHRHETGTSNQFGRPAPRNNQLQIPDSPERSPSQSLLSSGTEDDVHGSLETVLPPSPFGSPPTSSRIPDSPPRDKSPRLLEDRSKKREADQTGGRPSNYHPVIGNTTSQNNHNDAFL